MNIDSPVRFRHRRLQTLMKMMLVASVSLILFSGHAFAAETIKSWTGKLGQFDSSRWNTQDSDPQTLNVTFCSHNFQNLDIDVDVELRKDISWRPDTSYGSFDYVCDRAFFDMDVLWTSGITPNGKYFFKWEPIHAHGLRTDGSITITHS